MKHVLLLFLLFSLATAATAQSGNSSAVALLDPGTERTEVNVKIYPNPATSYIGLDHAKDVERLLIFNMVGRRVKFFEVGRADQQYYVGDLPTGMYLVQLLGRNNEVLSTKRLNKR